VAVTSSQSQFDAIVFDWGGVITVPPGPVVNRLYRDTGVDQKKLKDRQDRYRDDDPDSQFAKLERGELALEDYLHWSRDDLPGAELIWDPSSPHFLFPQLTVMSEVVDRISELRERGFLIGLLSNNIAEAWPVVARGLALQELFHVVVNSAFVGMRKPEHRIYFHIADELGVPVERVLFLDDNRTNVEAAIACGMHAIEVKQPIPALGSLERKLENS
jgi:epoxide hydrolase-like predicted phosphatase|tara:strand:+ start:6785 stop:7435 length:651 start_codon:yes stop_codon:yes gene_type:complete